MSHVPPGALVREVPYDPHLPFLFFGEEISMAVCAGCCCCCCCESMRSTVLLLLLLLLLLLRPSRSPDAAHQTIVQALPRRHTSPGPSQVRMWTRGWDVYSADEHVLYHLWERSYRPTFWEVDGSAALKRASQQRVRRLLTAMPLAEPGSTPDHAHPDTCPIVDSRAADLLCRWPANPHFITSLPPPDAAIWGLGDSRSLAAFESYAGVDFGAKRASAAGERGGRPTSAAFWAGPTTLLDGSESDAE